MSEGGAFDSFAGVAGVSFQTLYLWVEKHTEFSEAKAIGTGRSFLWWEKRGRGGLESQFFKPGLWTQNMKCRFPKQGWNPASGQSEPDDNGDGFETDDE